MNSDSISPAMKQIGAFQVPIFACRFDEQDLNRALRELVLAERNRSSGVGASNDGGWHSRRDLHAWPQAEIARLLQMIDIMLGGVLRHTIADPRPEHFDGWLIRAWANVNLQGARNKSHSHFWTTRRTLWSGVYYVDPGSSSVGRNVEGRTIFEDRVGVPRLLRHGNDPFGEEMAIGPEPGLMLFFPATQRHRVEPYLGDTERITIAWNLYHPLFAVPLYDDDGNRHPGVTLPRRWRGLGNAVARFVPKVRDRITYSRPPIEDDLARPLESTLAGSLAGPLRRLEEPVETLIEQS